MVASHFAHTLAERSANDDYRSIAKRNENEPVEYFGAHLKAQAFESAVVSDYYQTLNNSPVHLPLNSAEEHPRASGYTTLTMDYGNLLTQKYVYPTGHKTTAGGILIPNTKQIKKK